MTISEDKVQAFLEFFKDIDICECCINDEESCPGLEECDFRPNMRIINVIKREIVEVMG